MASQSQKKYLTVVGAAFLGVASAGHAQTSETAGMPAIKIAVADFVRTEAFYGALGMRLSARHNDHETSLTWNDPAQGSAIVMVRDSTGRFVRGGASIVIRVADMTAALNRLKAAGFAGFAGPRVRPGFTTLDIRDPDGNAIELIDQTPVPAK
jgi:catechol 2,3-dioxygenase-like lactoylglutathione lyase family enzyme